MPAINRVAFRYFMPLMLFYDIYTSDLSTSVRPALIGYAVAGVLCAYGLSLGYTLLTQKECDRKGPMRLVPIPPTVLSATMVVGL